MCVVQSSSGRKRCGHGTRRASLSILCIITECLATRDNRWACQEVIKLYNMDIILQTHKHLQQSNTAVASMYMDSCPHISVTPAQMMSQLNYTNPLPRADTHLELYSVVKAALSRARLTQEYHANGVVSPLSALTIGGHRTVLA